MITKTEIQELQTKKLTRPEACGEACEEQCRCKEKNEVLRYLLGVVTVLRQGGRQSDDDYLLCIGRIREEIGR